MPPWVPLALGWRWDPVGKVALGGSVPPGVGVTLNGCHLGATTLWPQQMAPGHLAVASEGKVTLWMPLALSPWQVAPGPGAI